MAIQCEECGEEAKWTERECPNCGRPFVNQRSGLIKTVHSRVHKLSDILIEDPSLNRKSIIHLKRAWDDYDPDEISKAKPSSRKRTLYVSSIYVVLAFFLFAALLMVSAPIIGDAPDENAGPGAEIDGDPDEAETAEAESNSGGQIDSDEDTGSEESGASDLDSSVTSHNDLEQELKAEGIQVEYLEGESTIWLDYETDANSDQEMGEEVETVAVAYADLVNSGSSYGSKRMDVIFMDGYGNDLGGFFIMNDWAQQYIDGELSLEEYVQLIITETFGYE